jgi:hypothetical protein
MGRRQHPRDRELSGSCQADSSSRPLRRRADRMARPARVRIRSRKPCVLARRRLLGWKVRLLTRNSRVVMPGRRRIRATLSHGSGTPVALGAYPPGGHATATFSHVITRYGSGAGRVKPSRHARPDRRRPGPRRRHEEATRPRCRHLTDISMTAPQAMPHIVVHSPNGPAHRPGQQAMVLFCTCFGSVTRRRVTRCLMIRWRLISNRATPNARPPGRSWDVPTRPKVSRPRCRGGSAGTVRTDRDARIHQRWGEDGVRITGESFTEDRRGWGPSCT